MMKGSRKHIIILFCTLVILFSQDVVAAVDFVVAAPYTSPVRSTCVAGNNCGLRTSEEHEYQVTIPSPGNWTFSLCGSSYDTYLYIGTGLCTSNIGLNDDFCGLQSERTVSIAAGTYYVTVEGFSGCGSYTLDISGPPVPLPEDDCVGAININCGGTVAGNTSAYTVDSPPVCGTGNGTGGGVWYKTTATCNSITASLCGSAYDTKIRVYSGTCGALVCTVGNDDFCGLQSQVAWAATPGTTYYILVHGFGGSQGAYSLALTCTGCCASNPPTADFTGVPATVCEGNSVTFTDNSSCAPTSWSWSFPGGTPTTSTAQNPVITYNTIGTYNVTLTATNAFGNDVKTVVGYINVINCAGCVNTMNVGAQTSTYISTMVRGYHFTAPTSFTICELYVPDNINTEQQHVEVVRFTAGAPPAFSAVTNSFVSLFAQGDWVPNSPIPCNIAITAGDIIGIYGARGNGTTMYNSYSTANFGTTIYGNPVTLQRSGMQFTLKSSSMHDIWSEVGSSVSRVIMRYGPAPLPVELLSFDGHSQGAGNLLEWTTATEINNAFFTVERSADGINFENIVEVDGAGNSNVILNYSAMDNNPLVGINYYRLKQTDFDGKFEYSSTIAIEYENDFKIYPSPASEILTIALTEISNAPVKIKIRNTIGQEVYSTEVKADSKEISLHIGKLPSGIYFLELVVDHVVSTHRFSKK